MSFHLVLLPFFIPLFLINFNIYVASSHCLGHQQSSLLQMKHNLVFNPVKSKKLVHWNQSRDCCQWNGIFCNKGRVIGVDLSEEFITGGLKNSSLFNLQYLQNLNLAYNDFRSLIPTKLGLLKNLRYLNLSNAGFDGQIPKDVFQIQSLKVLDISDNHNLGGSLPNFPQDGYLQTLNLSYTNFSGQLPGAISNLKQLSTLDLSNCQFSGKLPSFAELTQLVHLDLSFNKFTGRIPSLSKFKNLKYLSLFKNGFAGSITSTHWKGLSNLIHINLGDNSLSGKVPSTLFTHPSLQELLLSQNGFDGSLDEFPNSTLKYVDLSNNKLQGSFPMSLFHVKSLAYLHLSSNNLNGTIKLNMLQTLQNLRILGLSHNNLSVDARFNGGHGLPSFPNLITLLLAGCKLKEFPAFLRNQSQLISLDLSGNQIHGIIPNWIWRFKSMVHLNISNNFLTGLEGPFDNLNSNIFMVDLHSNQLGGSIPIFTKNAVHLDFSSNRFNFIPPDITKYLHFTYFLSLSNNMFHGNIPQSFCDCPTIRMLDLSHNSFNGSIPSCLMSRSSFLRVLNLVGNKLSGSISDTISSSCNLRFLDLNGNLLAGNIPESLANCQGLEVLNLGNNTLSDNFPCFLENILTLRVLILRSNKLHGSIRCQHSTSSWEMLHIVDLASNNFTGALPSSLLQNWRVMMGDEDEARDKSGNLLFDMYDYNQSMHFKEILGTIDKGLSAKLASLISALPRSIIENMFSYFINTNQLQFGGTYLDSATVVNKGLLMKFVKLPSAFTSLDFSCNNFEGPIPEELMNFRALIVLNMSHNAFSSNIPSSLGNLLQIESLDLSSNILSGKIPTEIASLSFLSVLNLSYNHLVGKIPTGTQIQSFDAASFEGNEGLCGPPLTKSICSDDEGHGLPSSPTSKIHSSIEWNFLSAELGFIFGFACVILPLIFWKRWRLWYIKHVEDLLYNIFPQLDFVNERCGGQNYRTLRWLW